MAEVSIIISTWNARMYIRECLLSLSIQAYKDFEVILVDNGSRDGTVELVRDEFPWVNVIENRYNLGFSKANNQGIEKAGGRYILTLNSDVVLDKEFIGKAKRTMDEALPCVGMVGGKVLSMDKKTIDTTGLVLSNIRRFYNRGEGEIDRKQFDGQRDIFGPCASSALYKREMLEDIKYRKEYFDEDFFFLAEDFDIAWRARYHGWQTIFCPEAICYHYGSSSQFRAKYRQYLSFRNRYLLILKNDSISHLIKNFHFFIIYDILRLLYLLVTNIYTIKGIVEVFILMPRMLKKRRDRK